MLRSTALAMVGMAATFRLAGFFGGPLLGSEQIHAVNGEPARITSAAKPSRLTVATWNIERGSRFDAIESLLRKENADVILLQEVDRFCRRSGNRDVARDLADALGMNWVSAGEFQEIGEGRGEVAAITGQAILSRFPIEAPGVVVFRRQSRLRWRINPVQPRRGGRIALHARTAGVAVYNAHLESSGADVLREAQLKDVLGHTAWSAGTATVIAGDFNTRRPAIESLLAAAGAQGFVDALGSRIDGRQTSVRHRHPIDWLFVRGTSAASGRVERVEGISDHFPLIATIDLLREER